jgi:hypothetical protein
VGVNFPHLVPDTDPDGHGLKFYWVYEMGFWGYGSWLRKANFHVFKSSYYLFCGGMKLLFELGSP